MTMAGRFETRIQLEGKTATFFEVPLDVRDRGGDLIEINPYPSELTAVSRHVLQGLAGEILGVPIVLIRARGR